MYVCMYTVQYVCDVLSMFARAVLWSYCFCMCMLQELLSYFNNEGEGLARADLMTKAYQVCTHSRFGKGR